MAATLHRQRLGPILQLTLDNPGLRNALEPALYGPLCEAIGSARREQARAIVLHGAGDTFSAGGNLQRLLEARQRPLETQAESLDGIHRVVQAIADSELPVIAAVEGVAAGAGLSLVLGCDLVVASASARFAMSHVRVGLSPDAGGTWWAAHNMPRQAAAEMLLEGGAWPVSRMHALGLVNEVTTDGHALEAALSRAAQFEQRSPHAVARIKALLRQARSGSDLMAQLQAEKASFLDCLAHADSGEAISAFLDKRAPRFHPTGD